MILWKCCTQYASKFRKLSSGPRTGKGQFSFQPQRKGMPKNVQTTTQLHSSHTLAKECLKFSKPGFSDTETSDVQMRTSDVKAGFRKGRATGEQTVNTHWIIEKAREFQKNIYFCFTDYAKAFGYVDHNKLYKILKDGNTRSPYLPSEKSVCRSRNNN